MTLSIWRYAHLALAYLSAAFLLILSITGVILAFDAVQEKTPAYRVENFDSITLAEVIPTLRDKYFEVLTVEVNHNDFVTIQAMDGQGQTIEGYIDPTTGELLGEIKPKSAFIQWVTALHRSLFLKETGRAIVGVVSFLLFIITISGFVLILKRQNGLRNFFAKINKDFFSQYFHVVTGRWMLIPVMIIALTGTFIFMVRLDFMQQPPVENTYDNIVDETNFKDIADIAYFQETRLTNVEKIEFPFIPDDPEEPFIINLKDRIVSINQMNGEIMHESVLPYSAVFEKINIDLHTGRTNSIWAIILGLASLNILFFMYTGFVITYKRTRATIKNKWKVKDAEIVLLVGSENGSTLGFASQIHQQLLAEGKKSYLAEMNAYTVFPDAKHLVVFTSTYGVGDAPTNATKFIELVQKINQPSAMQFTVVGFGSKAYEKYCAFAEEVFSALAQQTWATPITQLYTVNDRMANEFVLWAQDWSNKAKFNISTTPAVYSSKMPKLTQFKVLEKTAVSNSNSTFKIILKPLKKSKFQSGDLLAIYPQNNHIERLYSIGKSEKNIQLLVKLYSDGLGSNYLYNFSTGSILNARILKNTSFHFPKSATKVVMIANGTGIAPFLGMIENNTKRIPIHLYAGFRFNNELIADYQSFAQRQISKEQLKTIQFAFSREKNKQYVMDLLEKDKEFFADLLKNNGFVMICGSLQMQKDVEKKLDEIVKFYNQQSIDYYQSKHQIFTDCY